MTNLTIKRSDKLESVKRSLNIIIGKILLNTTTTIMPGLNTVKETRIDSEYCVVGFESRLVFDNALKLFNSTGFIPSLGGDVIVEDDVDKLQIVVHYNMVVEGVVNNNFPLAYSVIESWKKNNPKDKKPTKTSHLIWYAGTIGVKKGILAVTPSQWYCAKVLCYAKEY